MPTLTTKGEERLLRVSRNISKELGITVQGFQCLVWGDGEGPTVSLSTASLEQLSRLVRIYRALHLLFSDREQANSWLNRKNEHFHNKTALDFIYSDPQKKLQYVAEYLEHQLT